MTRRKKLFAFAIALPVAVAVGVGLKARRAASDTLSADICDKDLGTVFELCEIGGEICQKTPEGQEEACQAGCVMAHCPKHVSCTELDPIWCKPCEDEQGALFWSLQFEAQRLCEPLAKPKGSLATIKAYYDCTVVEPERRCPALAGIPQWYLPPDRRTGDPNYPKLLPTSSP